MAKQSVKVTKGKSAAPAKKEEAVSAIMPVMHHVEEPPAKLPTDVNSWMKKVDMDFQPEATSGDDMINMELDMSEESMPEIPVAKAPEAPLQAKTANEPAQASKAISEEEDDALKFTVSNMDEPPAAKAINPFVEESEEETEGMSMSFIEEAPKAEKPVQSNLFGSSMGDLSDEEEGRRKAMERINRLRNISFKPTSMNSSEYDEVPAYQRRDLDLHNTIANVEDYYSRSQVKDSEKKDGSVISTINNFLHGKKPD